MKLMIASDIHGSAYYCLEMLDAMKKECPDRLSDRIGYGIYG